MPLVARLLVHFRRPPLHDLACENIRFSSLFVAEDVSRETSSATKSEEKRMFSQAMHDHDVKFYGT